MFGIGSTELLVILVVALIVLGPKSLAGLSRSLGKAVGEFRRVSTDFQRTLNAEAAQEEMKEAEQKRREAAQNSATEEKRVSDARPFATKGNLVNPMSAEAANHVPDVPVSSGEDALSGQMNRIGNWEKTDATIPQPPPGGPLDKALAKARKEATSPLAHGGTGHAEAPAQKADEKQHA